jgi:sulfate permease, SulP family
VAHPHVAVLGRIPGTLRFSDLARHPDNERLPRVAIFRVEAALVYFNVEHVLHEVLADVDHRTDGVGLVVFDLSTSPYVDIAGARMLAKLSDELAGRSVILRLAEAHADVRDILRAEGIEAKAGAISRRTSLAEVIDVFQTEAEIRRA